MKNELIELLSDIRPEIDFEGESGFVDNGLLDSLDIVTIMDAISEQFDVDLGPDEMIKENFNSIDGMISMIEKAKK